MLVAVGSMNPVKIQGAKNALKRFSYFNDSEVKGFKVSSQVREQPIGKIETYSGAENRARSVIRESKAEFGIGVEDGLEIVRLGSGDIYRIISVCCFFDKKRVFYGEGSSYQLPDNVVQKVLNEKVTIDEALFRLGITKDERVGYKGGLISILSNEKINRKDIVEQAVEMSLLRHLNKKAYLS